MTSVTTQSNSLPDCDVVACVRDVFTHLKFDKPQGGSVSVIYPLAMDPK